MKYYRPVLEPVELTFPPVLINPWGPEARANWKYSFQEVDENGKATS